MRLPASAILCSGVQRWNLPLTGLEALVPLIRTGSASANFACPSRAAPSKDWAWNVIQAPGCFFWRMASHSRRIGSASAYLSCPEHALRLFRQLPGIRGRVRSVPLLRRRQPLPPPFIRLIELLSFFQETTKDRDDLIGFRMRKVELLEAGRRLLEQGQGLLRLPGGQVG